MDLVRKQSDKEGINHYFNRSDLTNGYLSSSCILPQGYTFGFLATDLSKWEIIGEKEYLNRKCVEISGKTESYGSKFNIVSFHMIVDEATGILLKLDGIDSEGNEVEIVRYQISELMMLIIRIQPLTMD